MSPWQNNEVFISLRELVQHLIYALKSHLFFPAFTNNHILHICQYFTLRFVSAFKDAAHTFLWFGFFFFCISKVLKSRGCWIPSVDLLRSTEYGADSSSCCHGIKGNEWCPVAQSEKPLSFTDVIRIGIAVK